MLITNVLHTPKDIKEFLVEELFQTDLFKKAVENYSVTWHDKNTRFDLDGIIGHFCSIPRLFGNMTSDVEFSHFSTWWNVIPLRPDYDNPYISDLYYLHEIAHLSGLTPELPNKGFTSHIERAYCGKYLETPTFSEFYRRATTNEFYASFISEVLIYFMIPELRKETFEFEIWVDRFLKNDEEVVRLADDRYDIIDNQGEWECPVYIQDFIPAFIDKRLNAMRNPDPFDWCELQIGQYLAGNQVWANIWRQSYRAVETHMADFVKRGINTSDMAELLDLTDEHIFWMQSHANEYHKEDGFVPFLNEAQAFNSYYNDNKKKFGNIILQS